MKKTYLATALGLALSSSAFAGVNLNAGYQLNSLGPAGENLKTQVATVAADYSFDITNTVRVAPGLTYGMGTVDSDIKYDDGKVNFDVKSLAEVYVRVEGDLVHNVYLFTAPKYSYSKMDIKVEGDKETGDMTVQGYGVDLGAGYKFNKMLSAEVKYGMSKANVKFEDTKLDDSSVQETVALNVRYSF